LASDLDPELFILDVDPPCASLTNFLEKIRAAHPNARALVIGARSLPRLPRNADRLARCNSLKSRLIWRRSVQRCRLCSARGGNRKVVGRLARSTRLMSSFHIAPPTPASLSIYTPVAERAKSILPVD